MREFSAFFLFAGLGGGALGFQRAASSKGSRFRVLGGVDFDADACTDFETLTGVPCAQADVSAMTPQEMRVAAGGVAPDVIFTSPPCKGFSGLLSKVSAAKPHYQALNRLVLQGLFLSLEAWKRTPPKLIILENVPNITTRGADLLRQAQDLLRSYGYRVSEGFHDCGELGGLAQHRRRFLMVARHEPSVPVFLYKPPHKRVRSIGEVIGPLPMPDDPSMGPLHRLPRLRWKTWVRLALIPAGGDWRALGLRREGAFNNTYRIVPWGEPCGAVTAGMGPSASAPCVADPRFPQEYRRGVYGVQSFDEPSTTVTGRASPSTGSFSVADPRVEGKGSRPDLFGVLAWDKPAKTVSGSASVSGSNTPAAVADPRVPEPDDFPDPPPIIIAEDGTWHRPLTTLELAALQGLPVRGDDGSPMVLAGKSHSKWRERIGNAVPAPAAQAIAEQMLEALDLAAAGTSFVLGGTGIWVRRPMQAEPTP